MNEREIEIVRFILANKKTHYRDIAHHMKLSQRTIASTLNHLANILPQFGVTLVRRPNVGIYIEGKTLRLQQTLQAAKLGLPQSKSERQRYILAKLLLTTRFYKLQELADALYVSRSTVENDLLAVRQYLATLQIKLQVSHAGIRVVVTEKQRRQAISQFINRYWGQDIYAQHKHGQLVRTLNLPPKLQQLFSQKVISLVLASLTEFIEASQISFSDYEFQSLAIHLMIALERIQDNATMVTKKDSHPTALLAETKKLVTILERRFQRKIPPEEQHYLNLHIIAVTQNPVTSKQELPSTQFNVAKTLQPLINFLRANLTALKPDQELLHGLALHLNSALKRLKLGLNIYNPYTREIQRNLPEAFDAAVQLQARLQAHYAVQLNDDELAFIALHFESFYERHRTQQRLRVVVVCSSGIGTSQLLAQRLAMNFNHKLEIFQITKVSALFTTQVTVDFVISTIPISHLAKPVIVVSPLLNQRDITRIQREIEQLRQTKKPLNTFFHLLRPDLVFKVAAAGGYRQVITKIAHQLFVNGYITDQEKVIQAAISREKLASTALDQFALPHVSPNLIKRPAIVLLVSQQPINWLGDQQVHFVFFMALNSTVHQSLREIYRLINQIIDDHQLAKRLLQVEKAPQLIQVLNDWQESQRRNFD